ncbi:hypothetical protein HYE06_04170 [Mycoplasmopsis bovis]|nr:hypothetical protein HYE06_04170 [Mycoplasmopsis bovis]
MNRSRKRRTEVQTEDYRNSSEQRTRQLSSELTRCRRTNSGQGRTNSDYKVQEN